MDSPLAGWYPDPYLPDQIRWWNGDSWTGQYAVKLRAWSVSRALLIACIGTGLVAWLGAALICFSTAQGIADLPQPNQALWVTVARWLPSFPVVASAIAAAIGFKRARSWRYAVVSAGLALLVSSVAVAFLAMPKPN